MHDITLGCFKKLTRKLSTFVFEGKEDHVAPVMSIEITMTFQF